ncbi:MAG: TonB-dependent receptor [Bacteroidales bacterium]|nr:TonB-dependent receptor [Bacteroidales bacterium]MBN2762817.1 TonB-dependent receptor [Bacteroidales bacterium]
MNLHIKLLCMLILGLFLVPLNADAQDRTVTGKITDPEGTGLVGVNIIIKGTMKGTISSVTGDFTLTIPEDIENPVLAITYIGYQSQEIAVDDQTVFNIQLSEEVEQLDEVVVTGYTSIRKSNITGAVSTVESEQLSKLPVTDIGRVLAGKAAGVRVNQATGAPGDAVAVRIRGVGTIGNNDPLYVIDGIPTKGALNVIAPSDIESITILKDASSASIYGSRSANGVVVITTKKGQSGKQDISYNGYYGVQKHGRLTPMVNTEEYIDIYNEAAEADNREIITPEIAATFVDINHLGEIFRTAPVQSHQVSVSGGRDNMQYLISGDYFTQEGIILNSFYDRYSFKANVNTKLKDRIRVNINSNFAHTVRNIISNSGDGAASDKGSVVRYAFFRTPGTPTYKENGDYVDLPPNPKFLGDGYNPVGLANHFDDKERRYIFLNNALLEIKITDDLVFRSNNGINLNVNNRKKFYEEWGDRGIDAPGSATNSTAINTALTSNNVLEYDKTFNELHYLRLLLGYEIIHDKTEEHGGSRDNYTQQTANFRYLDAGIGEQYSYGNAWEWALTSYFANLEYIYNNKYLLTFTLRRDGSSRFSEKNRYGTFFSGSLAWRLDNEQFMKAFTEKARISMLKLRASYGKLGNQEIGDYPWATIIGGGYDYPFGSSTQTLQRGYAISTQGNEDVKWETTMQMDFGLDLRMFKNKLIFNADYFDKITSDMLIPFPAPAIGGSASYPWVNAGNVENKGFELELGYKDKKGSFSYEIIGNFAKVKNEVLELSGEDAKPIIGGEVDNNTYVTITEVGQAIGTFYVYQTDGIFQSTTEILTHAYQGPNVAIGDVKYKDISGPGGIPDGTIDAYDRVYAGSAIPDFTYGLTINMFYKNFDFSVFFQGVQGNKVYMQINKDIEGFYRAFPVTKRFYDEHWTPENKSNTVPRAAWGGATNNNRPSTRFIEDGSYMRLKNIQLGYTLPVVLSSKIKMERFRIYISAQNMFTLTKFSGLDPEMQTSENAASEGDRAVGIDWGTYPASKTYLIGLNVAF